MIKLKAKFLNIYFTYLKFWPLTQYNIKLMPKFDKNRRLK